MLLESASGYMMPFAADDAHPVEISIDYGEQVHPKTGEKFNHRGIDLIAYHIPLYALASGTVIGVGTDAIHDNYIITRYGKYEVKYGHVEEGYVTYGQPVQAGQEIAKSGDFLHLEVTFAGDELDPKDFLKTLYGNIQQYEAMGAKSGVEFANMNVDVHTEYDKDKDEILSLMFRYLPSYFNAIRLGNYVLPTRTENSLRNVFGNSAGKGYFFEVIPSVANPLGISERGASLVSKVQNILIGDFLNYLGVQKNVFLSTWSEGEKKNFLSKQQPTVL